MTYLVACPLSEALIGLRALYSGRIANDLTCEEELDGNDDANDTDKESQVIALVCSQIAAVSVTGYLIDLGAMFYFVPVSFVLVMA